MSGRGRSTPRLAPQRWCPPPVRGLPTPAAGPAPTVFALPGRSPEDVVAAPDGRVITGLEDGRIVALDPRTGEHRVVGNTGGRPLGLAAARDGRLLVCDSHRGLLAMDLGDGAVEVLVDRVGGRRLRFCSNVTEADDGTLYFTESTDRFGYEHYKGAILEGRARGAVFRRAPDGTVTELLGGLRFANGIALIRAQTALVYAETTGARLSTLALTGPGAGTGAPLLDQLPGYPDNIGVGPDGTIWVAMVSGRNALVEFLAPRAPVLRRAVWRLPHRWLPDPAPLAWAIGLDPDDGRVVAQVRTAAAGFGASTGVLATDDALWLAGIGGSALARFSLPRPDRAPDTRSVD